MNLIELYKPEREENSELLEFNEYKKNDDTDYKSWIDLMFSGSNKGNFYSNKRIRTGSHDNSGEHAYYRGR